MHREQLPKHTRIIGVVMLVGLMLFYAFLRSQHSLFQWVVLAATLLPLYLILRGPHTFFSLDEQAIAWSNDLKRNPKTRILLADVQEVHLVEGNNADGITFKLVLVDSCGRTYKVTSGSNEAEAIFKELQTRCPSASFQKRASSLRDLMPPIFDNLSTPSKP